MSQIESGTVAAQPAVRTGMKVLSIMSLSRAGAARHASHASASSNTGQAGTRILAEAVVPAAAVARAERSVPAYNGVADAGDTARRVLLAAYPDIRKHAKQCVEAEILRRYNIELNADETYYNVFSHGQHDLNSHTGWRHDGMPDQSYTLTELQLHDFALAETDADDKAGIYREGIWAKTFARHNEIALDPAEVKTAIKKSGFQRSYRRLFDSFLSSSIDAMQIVTESELLLYAQGNARADARAEAIGLSAALAQRLQLTDGALAMLAAASGHPDPDFGDLGVHVYAFDINGYPSRDMAWLEADNGQVILVMPGNERHLREYSSLAEMRASIREMTKSKQGRRELASHFSAYNLDDGKFYQGVRSWLLDISKGGYDQRIARSRQTYTRNISIVAGLRASMARGPSLLSNKALAMLSEAAGYRDPNFPSQGTEAFVFDIDSYPSKDMSWLRSQDGHVVLIMPGNEKPVREYADIAAMRRGIRHITQRPEGRASLASHFSRYNRLDGVTYQGVDKWLFDIRDGEYDERIAYSLRPVNGSIFRNQIERMRHAKLEKLDDISGGKASSSQERKRWLQSFGAFNSLLSGPHRTPEKSESNSLPVKRVWHERAAPIGGQQRLQRWGNALRQRVIHAVDRVNEWMSARRIQQRVLSPEHTPPPPPPPSPVEAPFLAEEVSPLPTEGNVRVPNEQGFLERSDFSTLYRIESVEAGYRPELAGFAPDISFIVDGVIAQPMLGTFLTRDAAMRWWWMEGDNAPFRLYEIDARGLSGVSFGDNRVNNLHYYQLTDRMIELLSGGRDNFNWFYLQSQLASLSEDLVHLNIADLPGARIQAVRGVGGHPELRDENANPLEVFNGGPWYYDATEDFWEFNIEETHCS